MLEKHKIISRIIDGGIVAIVRVESPERAIQTANACIAGGLYAIELTFTMARAHRIIEAVREQVSTSCVLGAGTVLDSETARIAILSGASYIISPIFDIQTALLCNRYAIPYMAGCQTPTEALRAMEYGVEIIKLFPAALCTPRAIKLFRAPFPQMNIMPTGGVSLDSVKEWIAAGAVALGVGGDLVAGAQSGDFARVTEQAIAYRQAVAEARAERRKP